jgi:hypothetical protein
LPVVSPPPTLFPLLFFAYILYMYFTHSFRERGGGIIGNVRDARNVRHIMRIVERSFVIFRAALHQRKEIERERERERVGRGDSPEGIHEELPFISHTCSFFSISAVIFYCRNNFSEFCRIHLMVLLPFQIPYLASILYVFLLHLSGSTGSLRPLLDTGWYITSPD